MRTLKAFRDGVCKVLVATSVGEEGLDISERGLVVFYEPAVSGIRYIQRRGRTDRKLPGKAVILVADKTVDEYYFREGYRRARGMDRILQRASEKTVKVERKAARPPPEHHGRGRGPGGVWSVASKCGPSRLKRRAPRRLLAGSCTTSVKTSTTCC